MKTTLILLSLLLLATAAMGAGTPSKTPPTQDSQDYSCLNQEITAYKTAAAATVQSQADLALSQAQAYAALYDLKQSC